MIAHVAVPEPATDRFRALGAVEKGKLRRGMVSMKVIADLCIIPMGVGVSVSLQIALCERILAEAGLKTKLHAYGTNIQGEWDTVFAAIKRCHEALHSSGVPRISTSMRFGTRIDKDQNMEDKVRSVEEKLAHRSE